MIQSNRVLGTFRRTTLIALTAALLLGPALSPEAALSAEPASTTADAPGWADLRPILPEGLDLTGHAVYLDFWASWCPPCRKSFPWMAETAKTYGAAGLEVIAVCMDKDPKKAEKFLSGQGEIPFHIVYDPKGDVATKYDLKGMPTSLLFGPDGKLISRHEGFSEKDSEGLLTELNHLYPNATSKSEGH